MQKRLRVHATYTLHVLFRLAEVQRSVEKIQQDSTKVKEENLSNISKLQAAHAAALSSKSADASQLKTLLDETEAEKVEKVAELSRVQQVRIGIQHGPAKSWCIVDARWYTITKQPQDYVMQALSVAQKKLGVEEEAHKEKIHALEVVFLAWTIMSIIPMLA